MSEVLLRSIELENIRSYLHERVEFPEGTTLLSGDVGCGKSTILLAAEFALFGIQRGELNGGDILRHGKDYGSVRLFFEAAGKSGCIYRSLRRDKKGGISQDECYIELDGLRQRKTPGEIRAIVLEMLGYPMEYQTKNPIVYRYTVYTPQDEMKRILFADPGERLSIIRKILGIDKYGRIRDNASDIVEKELRAMRRELESAFADLDKKEKELSEKRKLLMALGDDYSRQKAAAESAARAVAGKEGELEAVMREIRELVKTKEEIARKESLIKEKSYRNRQIEKELSDVLLKLEAIEKALANRPAAPTTLSEVELSEKKRRLERSKSSAIAEKSVLESEAKKLEGIFQRGRCEFCGQDVSDPASFKTRIGEKLASVSALSSQIAALESDIADLDRLQKSLSAYNLEMGILKQKEREHAEKKAFISSRRTELERNKNEILAAEQELVLLKANISRLPELESSEKEIKAELSMLRQKKESEEMRLARLESQIEALTKECNRLEDEVLEKMKKKEKAGIVTDLINWMDEVFIPLMETIEKSIMYTVQQEFNGFFQKWFSILMGSENLSVSVDESFSPAIEQEGYRTEYNNLSGGEKTAVALAYRLALTKVVNSLIDTIRTKDIVILDEPTDGFSGEQIDRIRDVMQELGLRQMIIVSHEPKIDTFVDHVIRFHKEGHVSRVVAG